MFTQSAFQHILLPYKATIEKRIQTYLKNWENQTPLREACEYALLNGGKRFRPTLVLMLAKALGYGADVSLAALGVEFFHTASLIADDLPCMDDDDERRQKPSVHKVYGESTALLATYALISAGYECLAKNALILGQSRLPFSAQSDYLCVLALENASTNTGIMGATGGQFLDLYPKDLSISGVREIIYKKTVTLFEISFVLGWLFGGGDPLHLPLVKECAEHFGLAFQMADDLGDMAQDVQNGRMVNLANLYGREKTIKMFQEELQHFREKMDRLHLYSYEFQSLEEWLLDQVEAFV